MSESLEDGMTDFSIPDMTCGHCKKVVEETLLGLDAAARITVDLEAHKVAVDTEAPVEAMVAALRDAGYEARPL